MLRFTDYGYLPPGDHEMTFNELTQSVVVVGEPWISGWDEEWRLELVSNLKMLVQPLWRMGIEDIWIDGSFCSTKTDPRDVDAFFELPVMNEIMDIEDELQRRRTILAYYEVIADHLNQYFEEPVWDLFENLAPDENGELQTLMWHRYKVDLFPSSWGIYAGSFYPGGKLRKFEEFFRRDRYGIEKGLIKLVKG
jgi:hypothetical protein